MGLRFLLLLGVPRGVVLAFAPVNLAKPHTWGNSTEELFPSCGVAVGTAASLLRVTDKDSSSGRGRPPPLSVCRVVRTLGRPCTGPRGEERGRRPWKRLLGGSKFCYFDCGDGPTGVDVDCVRFIAPQLPPRGLSAGAVGLAQRRSSCPRQGLDGPERRR